MTAAEDTETFTKDEAAELRRLGQDIRLFLRLASVRMEAHGDLLPFRPSAGRDVIRWLHVLADRYTNCVDITKL